MRERLFDNLAEVDKSLRRTYVVQISLCLLFFYFAYNSVTVAGQKEHFESRIKDAEAVVAENATNLALLKVFGTDSAKLIDDYAQWLKTCAGACAPAKQEANFMQQHEVKRQDVGINSYKNRQLRSALIEYNKRISRAVEVAGRDESKTIGDQLLLKDLITLFSALEPLAYKQRNDFTAMLEELPELKDGVGAGFVRSGSVLDLVEVILADLPEPIQYMPATSSSPFGDQIKIQRSINLLVIEIGDRIKKLRSIRELVIETSRQHSVKVADVDLYKKSLQDSNAKLSATRIGAIKIPFTAQPLEIDFAFRLGPIAILLIQIFISIYYRHRYELISSISQAFDPAVPEDRKIRDHIYLYLWPWILNYPYFGVPGYQRDKQRGDFIAVTLINFCHFLPVLTIGLITWWNITFNPMGALFQGEVSLSRLLWLGIFLILLFLTLRQVFYIRRLERNISVALGWKKEPVIVEPAPSMTRDEEIATPAMVGPVSRLRTETIFSLLVSGTVLCNFWVRPTPLIDINLSFLSPLLVVIAGLKFGLSINRPLDSKM